MGYIKRFADPCDQRSNRTELTTEGMIAAQRAEHTFNRVIARKLEGFTDEESIQLLNFYKRMRQNLVHYKKQLDEMEESV